MGNNYRARITSHVDYEELRLEICIDGNEEALVLTQEGGPEQTRIEFWNPLKGNLSWLVDYHQFCRVLDESLIKLTLRPVETIADPNEKEKFSIRVEQGIHCKHPIVTLYNGKQRLGVLSQEGGIDTVQLEIFACPSNKYWEFSYRGFTDLLRDGYHSLVKHSEM